MITIFNILYATKAALSYLLIQTRDEHEIKHTSLVIYFTNKGLVFGYRICKRYVYSILKIIIILLYH